jgi:hypothetical protein
MLDFPEFCPQIMETLLVLAAFLRYSHSYAAIEEKASRSEAWRVRRHDRAPVGISGAAQGQAGRCDGAALTERSMPLTPIREGGIKRGQCNSDMGLDGLCKLRRGVRSDRAGAV